MAKKTTAKAEEPKQEVVQEVVQETAPEETAQVQEQAEDETTAKAEEPKQEKVYKFTSKNPYLTVASLGVQFIKGTATTKSLEVAKALARVHGVELVEE